MTRVMRLVVNAYFIYCYKSGKKKKIAKGPLLDHEKEKPDGVVNSDIFYCLNSREIKKG